MKYSEHLTEIVNEKLEDFDYVWDTVSEMSDSRFMALFHRSPALKEAVEMEFRQSNHIKRLAEIRAEHDAAFGQTTAGEDEAYDRKRQQEIDNGR